MSDESVTLVSPEGKQYSGPAASAAQLKAKGWRDLTPEETKENELQKKYGEGVLPAVGAAASGAASAATFGLSDVALAKTPLAEANREVSARNPTAHTLGQVGVLAAPILGELAGASTAGKVAQGVGAGVSAVSKGAGAVGELAGGAAKLVAPSIAPIVKGATTAAAEGAAFQVGANVGEAARRDAPLDAETILAHTGEAAILGAGIGAVIPAAGKVARWSAEKALSGLEQGVQGLRALGSKAADLGVDALEAGVGAVSRNAGAIGEGIEAGAKGMTGAIDRGAQAVAGQADNIGAAVEGAGNRVANAVDEHLLPRIRQGLTEQTGRPDIINETFASGEAGRAARKELGSQTLTGTREVHAQEASKALNTIWTQTIDNAPMFDDLALAAKRDLQASELAGSTMSKAQHKHLVTRILGEANTTLAELADHSPNAVKYFQKALTKFAKTSLSEPSAESLYRGLDQLKTATDKISGFERKASMGASSAGFAEAEAMRFRTFAKNALEDSGIWGEAAILQHEVNSGYHRFLNARDAFKAQFAAKAPRNAPIRVLDGGKSERWMREITGPKGDVRNAVVDDLVNAQRDLIALTERLGEKASAELKAQIASSTPKSTEAIERLALTKSAAMKAIDRAEVLQQTQSAILSRQGAGVNPLPVSMLQGIGGGALVGHVVGGVPGALVGGAITSALQKYGAVTSNPKSAIEFLNTIDRLRGADKKRVADWIRATLGETADHGVRGGANALASKVNGKAIGETIKRGADALTESLPEARSAIATANKATAKRILEARGSAQRGIEALATRADSASAGVIERLLPAVSYADVTNSKPEEWWARTQKAIVKAQSNPDALLDQLEHEVSGIQGDMPEVAAAITKQKLAVLGYLTDRMPRNPRPYMIGDKQWKPDPSELKAFRDIALVATKPDALLPLVTIGTASQAQVDAVKTLWPRKFEEVKKQVVDAVMAAAEDGAPVSYRSRIRVGQLLGVPMDASQEPGFVQWLQTMQAPAPPTPQPPSLGDKLTNPLKGATDIDVPMSMQKFK